MEKTIKQNKTKKSPWKKINMKTEVHNLLSFEINYEIFKWTDEMRKVK